MDSNQLLHYLRGFFELVDAPTPDQIRAIRNEVLRAQPVSAELIPVEVVDPIRRGAQRAQATGCGCSGTPAPAPPPYIDSSRLP